MYTKHNPSKVVIDLEKHPSLFSTTLALLAGGARDILDDRVRADPAD